MNKFIASRITEGNRVFPLQIIIDELGVTLINPSVLSGKEKTVPFSRISSVNIESPFVGYSTIIIETTGEGKILGHGFTKSEVRQMKELILAKI